MLRAAFALVLLGPAAACGAGAGHATETWPEGTVLAVDGLAVAAAEVDRVGRWVAVLHPEDVPNSLRRKALTAVVLPRTAARARHLQAFDAAWEELGRLRLRLVGEAEEPGPAPVPERRSGNWNQLGFDVWGQARELAPGTWSEPELGIGFVRLIRVVATTPGASEADRRFELELVELPFLGTGPTLMPVEAAIDAARLTIVDPAWEEIVPLAFVSRMRGSAPAAGARGR